MEFRLLKANEIDCRIATIKNNGLSLLLYKDARVDQNILDETVGIMNWERKHELIGENLYCTVSIWDEEKQTWIKKQDVGTESYTEKEKGQASDSFKRACFNFGIGRELYTAPFIWIPSTLCTITDGKCYDRFEVTKIGYDEDKNINELVIINSKTRVKVFDLKAKEEEIFEDSKINGTKVKGLKKTCADEKIPTEYVCELYGVSELSDLTEAMFQNIVANWDKLKAKYNERNNS